MVRGLKIECDLVDCICMPIFILASVLFAFAEAIEVPLRLAGQFVYYSYLHFARRFANWQRQQRTGGNARNIAASLPSEVNILIFRQMNARKDLKSFHQSNHPSEVGRYFTRFYYIHLHSTALVCRRWHADATIALYENVYLNRPSSVLEFARTLLTRPQLCPLVQLISFPYGMEFTQHYSTDGPFQDPDAVAMKSAVDRVLSQCSNARHFCLPLSGTPNTLADLNPANSFVTGLRQVLLSPKSRVRSLKVQGNHRLDGIGAKSDFILPLPEGSDMHRGFQRLRTLIISCADLHHQTLSDPRWPNEGVPALLALRRLVINQFSSISRQPFASLLAQTPALESLQMNSVLLDETEQPNPCIISYISQCASTLTHLRLIDLTVPVTLGNMDQFVRLRSLVIDAEILFRYDSATSPSACQLAVLPPNLEELIILHGLPFGRITRFNVTPLSLISAIRDAVTRWQPIQDLAAKLRNIEIWSYLKNFKGYNVVGDWEIGTFILRNLLRRDGIHVETFLAEREDTWAPIQKVCRRERRIRKASMFWRRII